MARTFSISTSVPDHAHADGDVAVVCVDVIRATTTAVTAVALGRRCFPARTVDDARELSARLDNALLAGEISGDRPADFVLQNSPTELSARDDIERPLVLLSTSGTVLMRSVPPGVRSFVGCLRNRSAVAARILEERPGEVCLIGAPSRGEFREEDQLCCVAIANALQRGGYVAADRATRATLKRWDGAPLDALLVSRSVTYLRTTGQEADLDFVLACDDDLAAAHALWQGEVVTVT